MGNFLICVNAYIIIIWTIKQWYTCRIQLYNWMLVLVALEVYINNILQYVTNFRWNLNSIDHKERINHFRFVVNLIYCPVINQELKLSWSFLTRDELILF